MPKRHPLYPEPGAHWVHQIKGMPEIDEPDLPEGKLSTTQVADQVEYEGLGFCVQGFISSERVLDKKLAMRWELARMALLDVVIYLDRNGSKQPAKKSRAKRFRPTKKAKKLTLGRKL